MNEILCVNYNLYCAKASYGQANHRASTESWILEQKVWPNCYAVKMTKITCFRTPELPLWVIQHRIFIMMSRSFTSHCLSVDPLCFLQARKLHIPKFLTGIPAKSDLKSGECEVSDSESSLTLFYVVFQTLNLVCIRIKEWLYIKKNVMYI